MPTVPVVPVVCLCLLRPRRGPGHTRDRPHTHPWLSAASLRPPQRSPRLVGPAGHARGSFPGSGPQSAMGGGCPSAGRALPGPCRAESVSTR